MTSDDEVPLVGGRITAGVVRVGNTVRRPAKSGTAQLAALLIHFASQGFNGTPRFLGIDEKGRAILSYIEGEVPRDLGYFHDDQLAAAARLLRRFHDASASFPPVAASHAEVLCHNDFGPPNAVFKDGMPVGMIDFDTAKPGSRLWDLGYSAMSWLDFGDSDYSGPEQLRRLRLFTASYDHPQCTAALVAVHAVSRQIGLAAHGESIGDHAMRGWANAAAVWTAANVVEPLHPSGL